MRTSHLALAILSLGTLGACTSQSGTMNDAYSTSSMSDTSSVTDVSSTDASSTMSAPADTSTTSMSDQNSKTAWDGKYLTGKHTVVLKTSKGDITVELDADVAPKTVTNFVTLAKNGYYNGLIFHRVIPGFMIQGGDPTGTGRGGESIYGAEFPDEIDASSDLYQKVGYKKGVIAMANHGPDTNGSQFFIMETNYPLDPNYTIFGHVTSGQDVVSAIAAVDRDANDRPNTPVTFTPTVKN